MRKIQYQIDNSNYGMLSNARPSLSDEQLLNREGYRIDGNTVLDGQGTPVAHIQRNYAERKSQGMYKQLKPTLVTK